MQALWHPDNMLLGNGELCECRAETLAEPYQEVSSISPWGDIPPGSIALHASHRWQHARF